MRAGSVVPAKREACVRDRGRRGHGKVILDPGKGEVLKNRRCLRRKLDAEVK